MREAGRGEEHSLPRRMVLAGCGGGAGGPPMRFESRLN